MAKLSVIIPVYNVEKYLPKCLDSVVNQTLKDIEIICVNDGTKDNSVAILEEYAKNDDRIKIIHKENGGLSSARNKGLEYVTSEFVTFLDSDDWVDTDIYEEALSKFNENIDLVGWYTKFAYDEGVEEFSENSTKWHTTIKAIGETELTYKNIFDYTHTVWNKIYRTKIIKDNNLLFADKYIHEDLSFYALYVSHIKKAYYIDKFAYHYLQRKSSIMGKIDKSKVYDWALKNVDYVLNYFRKNNKLEANSNIISYMLIEALKGDYGRTGKKSKKKLIKKYQNYAKYNLTEICFDDNAIINLFKSGKISKIDGLSYIDDRTFVQKIFSIRNITKNNVKKKLLTLFGLKFSWKAKN